MEMAGEILGQLLAAWVGTADDPLSGMRHLPACAWSGDLLYRLQLLHGAGSAGAPVWHGYNQDGDRNRAGDRSGIFASGTSVWMEAGDRGVGTWERR